MLKRKIELPPEHLYPADEWRIVETRYSDEFVGLTETVFSLGNGFVGIRGSSEEGRPALVPVTFVNGFHETWPITHPEAAHALARTGQTIVNVPVAEQEHRQHDVGLLEHLVPVDHQRVEFSEEQKRRNFDYYDALTTGDSSLSACVQSIIAAEIGRERQALEYFQYALLMDLGNVAGNASDGVHIASAAGVWSSLVFGFGGVRDFEGRLSFDPRLPRAWSELAFSLRFCGRQLRVRLTHDKESYLIEEGDPLEVVIRGEPHLLTPGTEVAIKLPPP